MAKSSAVIGFLHEIVIFNRTAMKEFKFNLSVTFLL